MDDQVMKVWWLIQGITNPAVRAARVAKLTKKFTPAQLEQLTAKLQELDASRAARGGTIKQVEGPPKPTDRQLAYLKQLGYRGPAPRTRKEASGLIEDQPQVRRRLEALAETSLARLKEGDQ